MPILKTEELAMWFLFTPSVCIFSTYFSSGFTLHIIYYTTDFVNSYSIANWGPQWPSGQQV